jgi:ubiquitin carboxyl-terminal hydrolase 2/21
METEKAKYGICRFNNIGGVTCYMNSILHILQQIPIFADYIYMGNYSENLKEKCKKEEDLKLMVTYELYRLFSASMNNDNISITPNSFKYNIGKKNDVWNEYQHQDSEQFFTFLIATLEEEIGKKVIFIPKILPKETSPLNFIAVLAWQNFLKNEFSPLKEIFNGINYNEIKCNCCSNISINFDPFKTIQLAIPINSKKDFLKEFTINDCIDHFYKEERFDIKNKKDCDMCGIKNRSIKNSKLWKTPKVLIIQFKRFLYNKLGLITQKITNNINYPICDFDIKDYIHPDSPYKEKSKYNLMGVNIHQGLDYSGAEAGHYTSFVKSRFDNNWYIYNDGAEPIKIWKKEHIQNKNAYLLFYYRSD